MSTFPEWKGTLMYLYLSGVHAQSQQGMIACGKENFQKEIPDQQSHMHSRSCSVFISITVLREHEVSLHFQLQT